MTKRYSNTRRAQQGFIQNFVIPGLVLLGVVIAGLTWLSASSSNNADNERASMLSNAVLAQGLTVTSAIQRAEADGGIAMAAAAATTYDSTALQTKLVDAKYLGSGTMPTLPAEAGSGAWTYTKSDYTVAGVGSSTADVLSAPIGGTHADAICLRINHQLFGTSTLAGTATGSVAGKVITFAGAKGTEGCVANTYYKVVNIH